MVTTTWIRSRLWKCLSLSISVWLSHTISWSYWQTSPFGSENTTPVPRGSGTPKDQDEVNRREVCECDGWVCDRDDIGAPSIFKVIRSTATLARMLSTCTLRCEDTVTWRKWKSPLVECARWTPEPAKSGQFPDGPVRIKVTQIHYVTSQTY